jgi:transcriptional regulator with XRE-family HTH domain
MPPSAKAKTPITPGHPGERIALLRNRLGLTQQELGTRAGIAQRTISVIEQGHDAKPATLHALAKALGTTIAHLYTPIE